MYEKLYHKLTRVCNNLAEGDKLEELSLGKHSEYQNVEIINASALTANSQSSPFNKYTYPLLQPIIVNKFLLGTLKFKEVQSLNDLDTGNVLMWFGEEYLDNTYGFHVGQRFEVVKKEITKRKLGFGGEDTYDFVTYVLLSHGKEYKFHWSHALDHVSINSISSLLSNNRMILVR